MPRTKPEIVVTVSEKRCSKCKIVKSRSEFYRCSIQPSGLMCACNDCRKVDNTKRYAKHKEAILAKARARFKENPRKYKDTRAAWRLSDAGKAYEEGRKPQKQAYMRLWSARNPDWQYKRHKERYKSDIVYHIAFKCRHRIGEALRRRARGLTKSDRTIKLLGCTFAKLKTHIEAQFTHGMTWQDVLDSRIHLDHIKPISRFDLMNPEEQLVAFNYKNLQPLWARDNFAKGNKWEESHNSDLQAYSI